MLLDIRRLSVAIGGLTLLDNLAFSLVKGKILGLVGESGSGKSLTAMAIAGLLPLIGGRIASGSILFDSHDLATLSERQFRHLRGRRIAFITQNPMTALDPLHRVGGQIDIVSRLHLGLSAGEARKRTVELLTRLRIADPPTICNAFPHQLSGGMKQRAVIAMALAGEPDLIVADEPTTALDVTVQMQIIGLLEAQVRERGLALILITHDMGVVAQLCDEVAVLYCGRMAEFRPVEALFAAPRHPYTRALIECIPRDEMAPGELAGIPGSVPPALDYPPGCRFAPRCNKAQPHCFAQAPELLASADGAVACHFPLEVRHA